MKYSCKLLLLVMMFGALSSCRKKNSDEPNNSITPVDFGQGTGRCRLSGIMMQRKIAPDSTIYDTAKITYDLHNRLVEFFNPGHRDFGFYDRSSKIEYLNDTVLVAGHYLAGTNSQIVNDTVFLLQNGKVRCWLGYSSPLPNNDHYTTLFEYDTSGNASRIRTTYNGQFFGDDFFTWSNGDVVVDSFKGYNYTFVTTYEYYTDKSVQYSFHEPYTSGLFYIGMPMVSSKHLMKSFRTPQIPNDEYYKYTFDTDGKIISDTSLVLIGTSSPMLQVRNFRTYLYECR